MDALPIQSGVTLPAEALSFVAVRASGPGGQNVNKVSSAVLLYLDLARCPGLSEAARARIVAAASSRHLAADGRVVLRSHATRDQGRNLEDARTRLAQLIREALVEEPARVPTRTPRSAKRRRVADKRAQAQRKQARRFDGGED